MVLNNGKVVGKGRHLELLAKCEVYQEIVKSQYSDKEFASEMKKAEEMAEKAAREKLSKKATSKKSIKNSSRQNIGESDVAVDEAPNSGIAPEVEYA